MEEIRTDRIRIENVTVEDAPALLAIYKPYVEQTAITFEYQTPTVEEFAGRIRKTTEKFPYLKAVDEKGRILGYSYASTLRIRRAFDWSVETTIYLNQDIRKRGIGRILYTALEDRLKQMGILNAYASIAMPKGEDPYLTLDSPRFHEKLGYRRVGLFESCGYKFGRWYDMAWYEKMLGEHKLVQEDVKFGLK